MLKIEFSKVILKLAEIYEDSIVVEFLFSNNFKDKDINDHLFFTVNLNNNDRAVYKIESNIKQDKSLKLKLPINKFYDDISIDFQFLIKVTDLYKKYDIKTDKIEEIKSELYKFDLIKQKTFNKEYIIIDHRVKKEVEKNTKQHLTQKIITKKSNKYLTELYLTRNKNGVVKFLFGIDYKNYILNNSSLFQILKEQDKEIIDLILEKSCISLLQIKRRNIITKQNTLIISASEHLDGLIKKTMSDSGTIEEINLHLNTDHLRFFTGDDFSITKERDGLYEYTLELHFFDSTKNYFQELVKTLNENLNYLIALEKKQEDKLKTTKCFTDYILAESIIEGTKVNYDKINHFNLGKYLIEDYQNLINKIEKFNKNIITNSKTASFIFKNMYNVPKILNVGYDFLELNDSLGLNKMQSDDYYLRLQKEKGKYIDKTITKIDLQDINDTNKINLNLDTKLYSFLSPQFINYDGKNSLKLAENENSTIKNSTYVDAELSIIDYNNSEREDLTLTKISKKSDILEKINNKKGITTSNKLKNDISNSLKEQTNKKNINSSVDSSYILKSLIDFESLNKKVNKDLLKKYLNSNLENIPWQILCFENKKDKHFQSESNIINDVIKNTKFNLLYNTLVKIEYLESFDEFTFKENWKLMTKQIFDNLDETKQYLCKLTIFQSKYMGVNDFEKIKLPLFDNYFILVKNTDIQEVSRKELESKLQKSKQ